MLESALKDHPDRQVVHFLIHGLTFGFHPGMEALPESSFTCRTRQSAIAEPATVSPQENTPEKRDSSLISLLPTAPLPPVSTASSPVRTFPCTTQPLHTPPTRHHHASCGAWLAKADITSTFKVLPIRPDYWGFFGVQWKGHYYLAVRLTFGCKSSPKIFDSLSEALCWILLNNHKPPYVIHLLDDFLTVTSPASPPSHSLSTLKSAFLQLGVPLSPEKTAESSTSLHFLCITLDSLTFQATLPTEKLHCISLYISNYLLASRCTKRQLLSLLGHLNFAIRIIPQGRSFLSHLLSISATIPSLHNFVTLDTACKMELRVWRDFLSSLNSVSFFYDDHLTQPEDIQLYTDAAPSIGFDGYYGGRWFASEWPPEMSSLSPSSALYELYPIIIAALLWGHEWSSKVILIHSDNLRTIHIINKGCSQSLDIMKFIRRLTLISAQHQFIIRTAHVPGYKNTIAGSLSCFSFRKKIKYQLRHLVNMSQQVILNSLAPSTLSSY
ncbi:uncharacterized protein [Thunnus thynnus]|uniref:uncharacterized protein n=1 Tax=Thunnus thynnus TaxID=8237 RepID=UPI003529CED1